MQKINIKIKKDATLEYEVKGVKGKGCTDVTKFIDKLGKVTEQKKTAEYHQVDTERARNRNTGGD